MRDEPLWEGFLEVDVGAGSLTGFGSGDGRRSSQQSLMQVDSGFDNVVGSE